MGPKSASITTHPPSYFPPGGLPRPRFFDAFLDPFFKCLLVALEHVSGAKKSPLFGRQDGTKIAPKWSSRRFQWPKCKSSNSLCFTTLLRSREGPKTGINRVQGGFVHFFMYVDFHIVFEPLLDFPKSNLVGNMSPPRGPKMSLRSGQNDVKN